LLSEEEEIKATYFYFFKRNCPDTEFGYNFPYLGPHELQMIQDAIRNDQPGKKIVIFACGIGKLALDIASCTKYIQIIAFDINGAQTQILKEKYDQLEKEKTGFNTNLTTFTADAKNLTLEQIDLISSADIVCIPNLIHFFTRTETQNLLQLVNKTLNVDGKLYLFWQPFAPRDEDKIHDFGVIKDLLPKFKLIDLKILFHTMRGQVIDGKVSNVLWTKDVYDVPSPQIRGTPETGPINYSLILWKTSE